MSSYIIGFLISISSQGAKWVYLTWDAVKGLLVSFCSVASTYQILTAQPENYVAGKKLLPFPHFPLLLILSTFSETQFVFKYYTFKQIIVFNLWEIHLLYVIHSKFIHIHGAYLLFVIKNVIFKHITCKQSILFDQFGAFWSLYIFWTMFYMRHYICNG